jgi:hypothetical protein
MIILNLVTQEVLILDSVTGTQFRKKKIFAFHFWMIFLKTLSRATTGGERYGGKGSNGGVWEWTSTVFDKFDGFVPSKTYPGYYPYFGLKR